MPLLSVSQFPRSFVFPSCTTWPEISGVWGSKQPLGDPTRCWGSLHLILPQRSNNTRELTAVLLNMKQPTRTFPMSLRSSAIKRHTQKDSWLSTMDSWLSNSFKSSLPCPSLPVVSSRHCHFFSVQLSRL